MKTIYKSILFMAITGLVVMINFSSCSKDEDPYISYIRVPNTVVKDSLLAAAPQGQIIAIIGGNLQNTKEVWFNDIKASLTPGFITSTSIVVAVPVKAPGTVTNQIKLVFANGNVLLYDFSVTINKPRLDSMLCEYVEEGDEAVINGNFFYFPVTVTFPGGDDFPKGITVNSEDGGISINEDDEKNPNTILTVKVPKDANTSGPLIVETNFGKTESGFWFLDKRNIFQDFNDAGWWAGSQITEPGPGDPPAINGPYRRLTGTFGDWPWKEVFSWWFNHKIPDDAIINPKKYNYKFEVNTLKPFNANGFQIHVSDRATNTNAGFFFWDGNSSGIDTKGQWQTIVFPLEDVLAKRTSPLAVNEVEYFFGFILHGSKVLDCDMCFDNFRIVPKQK